MLIRIKRVDGTVLSLTCQHVILHQEKGKDGWIEVIGLAHQAEAAGRIDTSYMLKGLCNWSTYDYGRLIDSNTVPLSVRLGRSK